MLLVYANEILAVDGTNYIYSGFDGDIHLNASAGDVVLQGIVSTELLSHWQLSNGLPYASGELITQEGLHSQVYTWPAGGNAPTNLSAVIGDTMGQDDTLISAHDGWVHWISALGPSESIDLATQQVTKIPNAQSGTLFDDDGNFYLASGELQLYFSEQSAPGIAPQLFHTDCSTC